MLMKPVGRWHEKTIRAPVDPNARLSFLPQKRIAFPGKNHDVRARSMPMASRVSAGWILLEVGAHRIASQMHADSGRPLTSQASIFEAEVPHVRDEIGLPRPVARDFSS